MEPTLQERRDLMEGYVLDVVGATVPDAIRTMDISIPQNRQLILSSGRIILTKYNTNDRPGDLRSEPPDLASCVMALEQIQGRKDVTVEALRAELAESKAELKSDVSRGERSFWRARVTALERKIEVIATEDVAAEELHRAFIREDVTLHAKFVPPEMREAMEAVERERRFGDALSGHPA